ncbi:MAG TPA: hypothetical protein VHG93_01980 [Longimicrobium sp.]|nr:hypothetical protein [Longimicrobium sp.]
MDFAGARRANTPAHPAASGATGEASEPVATISRCSGGQSAATDAASLPWTRWVQTCRPSRTATASAAPHHGSRGAANSAAR